MQIQRVQSNQSFTGLLKLKPSLRKFDKMVANAHGEPLDIPHVRKCYHFAVRLVDTALTTQYLTGAFGLSKSQQKWLANVMPRLKKLGAETVGKSDGQCKYVPNVKRSKQLF